MVGFRAQFVVHLGQQLNTVLQLAISMIADLGLNKGTPARERLEAFVHEIKDSNESCHHKRGLTNLDEVRAVLGCFFLSSYVGSHAIQYHLRFIVSISIFHVMF
jgi:hypothetical protein